MSKQYELLWRNKWITASAKSITEMADLLARGAEELQAMAAAGITLKDDGAVTDDYATLVTLDAATAARFGMEAVEDEDA